MEVICLENEAFYTLIESVIERVKKSLTCEKKDWISRDEAMIMLHIKSKTTLQKLRDTGKIRFSQLEKKIILYDVRSINDYLELNAKKTF